MWLTIAGVWSTISTLLDWIYDFFSHLVDKCKVFWRNCNDTDDDSKTDRVTIELEDSKAVGNITDLVAAAAPPIDKYDVFINHRGPDVKLTFAAHLTDALLRAGLRPFLDAKSIGQGHHIFKSIDEALSGACVHVAIFSKGYAESKYCLQELCDMLQTQRAIIPVFYDVEPGHLRYINSGPYAKGFRKHQSHGRYGDQIQKWKDALVEVSERRGFRKDEVNGDENQLVRSIVEAVLTNLRPVKLQPQKGQVCGLEESLQEVLDTVTKMNKNVGILCLVGMGGIGKTTLATEIYNHYVSSRQFKHHSFLKDVRSSEQLELQQQLVKDLMQQDMKGSSKEYRYWFDVFRSKRLLIIVDDIDNAFQFESLIPDILGLADGSLIVVASRDRNVLNSAVKQAKHKEVYEVKVLNPMDSRQLFNWHAFGIETENKGFHNLAEQVADACGGHPLALEVIGASLIKKDPDIDGAIWMDTIRTLKENDNILDKLRISYTGLPTDGDRAMFRDIACLMIGMHEDVAMELWKSCSSCGDDCSTTKGPSLVLRRLVDRSLVKLDAGRRLGMHDVIRDMGRDVVIKEAPRKPGKRTHLWDAATAAKVLAKNLGTYKIRGIKLSRMDSKCTPTYSTEEFVSMEELHLLILDGCLLVGKNHRLSQELRWMQWRSFPGTQLPSGLNLPNLIVLDLIDSCNLSHLWEEQDQIQFPALQRLILTNCRRLQELPDNIGQNIPNLRTMEMEKCSLIGLLPSSLGEVKYLEHLILSDCESLETLPDAVVNLTKLKRLILDNCKKLKQLPMELGRLVNLEVLNLSHCQDLLYIPPSVKGLQTLMELHSISACKQDGRLLEYVGAFKALKILHVGGTQVCNNDAITVLPQSFEDLKSLLHLEMAFCPSLLTIEALPRSLLYLDMANCTQLIHFPFIGELSSLITLNLCNCKSLTQISGLECLTALEEINLAGCTSLQQTEQQVLHCRSMRICYLSGSNVALIYDNNWSETEPTQQLISYYDDAIGYITNGMTQKFIAEEWSHESAVETTILSETKCLAVIFCFVVHDQGWSIYPWDHGHYNGHCYMDVWIMRKGMRVYDSHLFTVRHADEHNQVYLCTFRRKHPFVQLLKVGDKICVYARSQYPGWKITVQEGAVCVVHDGGNQHQAIAKNSKFLSKVQSKDLVPKFNDLVLVDHYSLSLESESGKAETSVKSVSNDTPASETHFLNIHTKNLDPLEVHESMFGKDESKSGKAETSAGSKSDDTLTSKTDSLSIDTENPDPLEQRRWIIEPAYGLYSWIQSWKLPRAGQGIISFVAQGRNDINMAISEQRHSRHPMYEIIIGGWMNTASAIQRTRGDIDVSHVAAGLTNPGAANHLWVSVDARTSIIQVGRGEPFQDVIAIYRDTDFYSGIRYISFTTYDTQITYSNVVIAGMEQPTPVLDAYKLSEKVYKQVLNDAWAIVPVHGQYSWAQYWMLPRPGRGIVSFTAEGSKDIHVAISARPHSMNPMYEINFGNWENCRTLIRRNINGPLGPIQCGVEYGGLTSLVNQLWISLDVRSGIIQLGQGEPGQNMYCIYKDPAFLSEACYFSFTTLASPVIFSNVAVTEILD